MGYLFEQVVTEADAIVRKPPERPSEPSSEIAIVVHLFYADIWHEIEAYLDKWDRAFDLYITLPPHTDESVMRTLLRSEHNPRLFVTENRGRDVLPFLLICDYLGIDRYRYLCKLHTKKTGDSPLGHVWRKLLYFDLIGGAETVAKIVGMFDNDETVGQVTGKYTVLDSQRYAYGNNTKIKRLCETSGIPFDENYDFAGGTMFWTRPEIVAPLVTLFREEKLDFEEERGQKDHTLAHAVERFFGLIVKAKGMHIAPSPSDYADLPAETVEQTAALVLSQQYAGQDVYDKINELNDYVHELEALAESMRLKNRLKRLPSDLLKLLKRGLRLPDIAIRDSASLEGIKERAAILPAVMRTDPAAIKKAWYYLRRGEVGFVWRRAREKLRQRVEMERYATTIDPKAYFAPFDPDRYKLPDGVRVDIVIPVYNGYDYLPRLFDTLAANTTTAYRLLVVNDAGDDPRVLPYLKERLAAFRDAELIENEENLGFVKSVLRAVERTQGHFVILNTDTEVPKYWLERLMYPIFTMPKTASTTPFTNAGTIASFPRFLEDNPIFEGLDIDRLDEAFREVAPERHYAKVPTGVGFCMGVNYDVVREIGFFDAEVFGKGYGEENDWCQRAAKHGYSNLLVPNLFVYHKHGGSFPSETKRKLLEENHKKLLARHPDYDLEVQRYIAQDPHKTLRRLLVLTASSKAKKIWLMFDHGLGGGANRYAEERIEERVASGDNTLLVRYDFYTGRFVLYHRYKSYDHRFGVMSLEQLDTLLKELHIGTVFLNSLVGYPHAQEMLEYLTDYLDKSPETTLIVPIHDYYAICPSYTLLDENGRYCGVPDRIERCRECMLHNDQEWKTFHGDSVDIDRWRELWRGLLARSAQVICFSNSSKEILDKAYDISGWENVSTIPHRVSDIAPVKVAPKRENEPTVIGILGAINYAKGAAIVKALVEAIEARNLPFKVVVVGEITERIRSERFEMTGKYKREALPSLIRRHRIDLFVIPSIWPETFSYTAEEVMRMELPLVVFDIGAPAERVKHYEKGTVLPDISAEALLSHLTANGS